MSASTPMESNVIADRYRCDAKLGAFDIFPNLPNVRPGYFRLGKDTICYGRTSTGIPRSNPTDELDDMLPGIRVEGGNISLPFDPNEVIENLRYERYAQCYSQQQRAVITTFAG